jgi:hypothetical protein
VIIVSGRISVDPDARDAYLRGCVSVVEQVRASSRVVGQPDQPAGFENDSRETPDPVLGKVP